MLLAGKNSNMWLVGFNSSTISLILVVHRKQKHQNLQTIFAGDQIRSNKHVKSSTVSVVLGECLHSKWLFLSPVGLIMC